MATPLSYCTSSDIGVYIPQYASDPTGSTVLMALLIDRMSRRIDKITGRVFYTSSTDVAITLNGSGRYRQTFPLDIVSVTTLQLATDTLKATSGTYTTISTGDFYLMPRQMTDSGWPYQWIELSDDPSGSYSTSQAFTVFPAGYDTVKGTGTSGWGAPGTSGVPVDIRHACASMVVRAWRAKDQSYGDSVGVEGLGTVSFSQNLTQEVRDILGNYTRTLIR